jgi:hypothetical protein
VSTIFFRALADVLARAAAPPKIFQCAIHSKIRIFMDTKLDADEYFQLALHASATRNSHACMQYLKELLEQEPRHAAGLYLLAAQHVELG